MQRSARHIKILELISSREIETQEELCDALRQQGFLVTQATVSRDIKELHLFKVAGESKRYKYTSVISEESGLSPKMRNLFHECVLSVRNANNLVLLKTLGGNASNAGMVVDKLELDEILGTVAGDDTLLVVCDTNEHAESVVERLKELLK